ncbi:MAG: PHP domain-containing protein [Firmicutes bacterium]|nr:PHP domain-containing protein [Bacillota bacterium]
MDLHVHSTESDGTLTPSQIVQAAEDLGLAAVSVTDHDSTAGVREALSASAEFGIEVLTGVEVSTEVGQTEVHILGYLIDPEHCRLTTSLTELRDARRERVARMVDLLRRQGYGIDLLRVQELAGTGAIGRPHVARALVEKGYVRSQEEAFDRLIGRGRAAYVDRFRLRPREAVLLIGEAGGVPVLAHPGLMKDDSMIPDLVEQGVLGIEAYHPEHSAGECCRYDQVARERGLLVTGGSDCHGPGGSKGMLMGQVVVPYASVEALKECRRTSQKTAPVSP